ncbi:unnamed protein product [Citrullus colocynthis]|uniref:Uncharacterized protein n=1 Tax=Citrullus colocynthis TaxID=252529 RepID=A0ABP0Z5Z8_9ROSI
MEELSPGRGWLLDGARVIKAQNGKDFSLSRLNAILNIDSSLHMQDPAGGQPAANPAAEKPSQWTSGFWEKLTSCFVPQTQDGGDSISPTEPTIANWIEDVDLPRESPSETLPDLRKKCSILIESFSKTQSKDPLTWQDIA